MRILISSAVGSPMSRLYLFRTCLMSVSSNLLPAVRTLSESTIPPRLITAMSVVPPPISTTMFPPGMDIGKPAPIAAAMGSSIVMASPAPASFAAWSTALLSTFVTPLGTQIRTLGLKSLLFPQTLLNMYSSILSVVV